MARSKPDPATGLTEQQERFCVCYVTGGPNGNKELIGNATACYKATFRPRKMKPASINNSAYKLLNLGEIQSRIVALRGAVAEKAEMSQAEILKIAGHMARATLADFYNEDGSLKLPSEWTEEMRHAAAGLKSHDLFDGYGEERTKIGEVRELKMVDKNQAVDRWFKHFGLYEKDNKQKTDPIAALLAEIAQSTETSKLTYKKRPVG